MKTNLTFTQAMDMLLTGRVIKLPEWEGYWKSEEGKLICVTRKGETCEPFVLYYYRRADWKAYDLEEMGGVQSPFISSTDPWPKDHYFINPTKQLEY